MQANRRADTKPELLIRASLHAQGYRFRKNFRIRVPGRIVHVDIAFPGRKLAVFVDGCFWHGCPTHRRTPSSNAGYWTPKLDGNIRRDELVTAALQAEGWNVLRIWEHVPIDAAVAEVAREAGLPRRSSHADPAGLAFRSKVC